MAFFALLFVIAFVTFVLETIKRKELPMTRTFTCHLCETQYESTWSEEEAWLEATYSFGPKPPDEESVSLCTSCHMAAQAILRAYHIEATWEEPDLVSPLNGLMVQCMRCKRVPLLIDEYRDAVADQGVAVSALTTLAYVVCEEGTYNKASGQFCCTECYLALGSPVGEGGQRWTAP